MTDTRTNIILRYETYTMNALGDLLNDIIDSGHRFRKIEMWSLTLTLEEGFTRADGIQEWLDNIESLLDAVTVDELILHRLMIKEASGLQSVLQLDRLSFRRGIRRWHPTIQAVGSRRTRGYDSTSCNDNVELMIESEPQAKSHVSPLPLICTKSIVTTEANHNVRQQRPYIKSEMEIDASKLELGTSSGLMSAIKIESVSWTSRSRRSELPKQYRPALANGHQVKKSSLSMSRDGVSMPRCSSLTKYGFHFHGERGIAPGFQVFRRGIEEFENKHQ